MDALLELINNLYSAAAGERLWGEIAPEIAQTLGSTSVMIQEQRAGASSTVVSITDDVKSQIEDHPSHDRRQRLWVERTVAAVGLSKVAASADFVLDHEFKKTEFYRDWCRPLGVFYAVGAVFPTGPSELGVLAIHRPHSSGVYEAPHKHLVSRLMPHLQRALRLRERLNTSSCVTRGSLEVLAKCQTAGFVVTGDGRLLQANSEGAALLKDGSAIRSRQGRISASRETDAAHLLALIRSVSGVAKVSTAQDEAMLVRRPNGVPVSVLVAPFRVSTPGCPSAGALVFVRDPARASLACRTLQTLYALTPTEARIAEALARGNSIETIATDQHSSLETVRKQVKGIFAKTATHRQAECVAVILRSVASMHRNDQVGANPIVPMRVRHARIDAS